MTGRTQMVESENYCRQGKVAVGGKTERHRVVHRAVERHSIEGRIQNAEN